MADVWGTGRWYQRGSRWWIAFYVHGKEVRESAGKTEEQAKRRLRQRLKEVAGDRYVGHAEERITVDEMADELISHLEMKGAKSVASFKSHLKPIRQFFALQHAVDLTPADIDKFMKRQLEAGVARATVNRQVGALRQALNLARKRGRLTRVPYISMLHEDNTRQGFFERPEFEALVAKLEDPIKDVAQFGYLTGWRKGEITGLRWESVDRAAKEVRLRTSKNGSGRVLPLEGELWDLMERRWAAREVRIKRGVTKLSEYVFHRRGHRVVEFRKAWDEACEQAKLAGKLFHDLRRTAVRNMARAGVAQAVAMSISGHKTTSMFLRYNISSEEDKRQALASMQEYVKRQPVQSNVTAMPQRTGTE